MPILVGEIKPVVLVKNAIDHREKTNFKLIFLEVSDYQYCNASEKNDNFVVS